MPWSRESRQTAAALCLLAIGLALLAAPSLLARQRPAAPLTALEVAQQALDAERARNPSHTGRPQLPAEMEAAFASGPPGRASQPQQTRLRTAGVTPLAGDCRAVAAQIKRQLDDYRGRGGLDQAEEQIEAAAAAGQSCPELYIEQARLAMKSGGLHPDTLKLSEVALRKGLKLDPAHGNTFVLLGYVLTHQSRYDEATAAFDAARKAKAGSPWLELNHGELLLEQGKIDEGLRHYQTAIDDPAVPENVRAQAVEAMARQFARDGRQADSREAYEKLIAAGHDDAWTLGNYAQLLRVHMLDTKRSLEMARRSLQKMNYGLGRENLGSVLYLLWAEALITQKNPAKARKLYAEAEQYLADPGDLLPEIHRYPRAHPIVVALKQKGYSLDLMPGGTPGAGDTPLSMAAKSRNRAVTEQLIDAGANPDLGGYGGVTALMYASYHGDANLVRSLLRRGADPWVRESKGRDAEAIAREAGQTATAQLIAAAKRSRKPGSATNKGVGADGLPLMAHRYRARRLVEGPTRDFSATQGEIVVFEGTNGLITQQGQHDPDGLWLNFRNTKGNEVQLKQQISKLDWQAAFEFVPEP